MIEIKGLTDLCSQEEIFSMVAGKATEKMTFVEVGVFVGSNICWLAQKCEEREAYPDIWAIDLWQCEEISQASKDHVGVQSNFEQAFEDNLERCEILPWIKVIKQDSLKAADYFRDKSIDFLFLDDDHTYPHTRDELVKWLPKMKKNSIIAGHDYPAPGVQRAVEEVLGREGINVTSNGASYWRILGNGLQ
jgi:hypothetical protein